MSSNAFFSTRFNAAALSVKDQALTEEVVVSWKEFDDFQNAWGWFRVRPEVMARSP